MAVEAGEEVVEERTEVGVETEEGGLVEVETGVRGVEVGLPGIEEMLLAGVEEREVPGGRLAEFEEAGQLVVADRRWV